MAPGRPEKSRPKPVPSQVRKQTQLRRPERQTPSTVSACGVCHREDCQLQSHKGYLANKRQISVTSPPEDSKEATDTSALGLLETSYAQSYAYTKALPSLGAGRLDGFHDLPIPGGHRIDLHQSVYNLLHSKMGSATAYPLPDGLAVNDIGGSMVIPVLTDTSLCLSVIAAWKAVQFIMGQATAFPHLQYESMALQSLRQNILKHGSAAISDEAILASALLWASATMFAQPEVLKRHATGVRALITARGGLKAMSQVSSVGQLASIKQLVLWADFLTAQFVGEKVLFDDIESATALPPSLVKLSRTIATAPPLAKLGLETLEQIRHMKLLLHSHDSAMQTGRISISEYKALTSLLNRSTVQRINLEHSLKNSTSPDECVVLAMNILRLTVLFHAGPLFTIVVAVISRLRNALKRTTLDTFVCLTSNGLDIYIWACFVGLVNEFITESRAYFVEMLSNALNIKFKETTWPEDWQVQNLEMLRSFLWSETSLTPLYFEACQRIEAQILTPDSQQSMW